jgi:hypothetical protein
MAASTSAAPVCPTSKSQPVPGQPGVMHPTISRAIDLPSVINVVNQLSQVVNNQLSPITINNVASPTINFFGTPALRLNSQVQSGSGVAASNVSANFQEVGRTTETVRVHNPDDADQWVEVDRITSLSMRDSKTGSTWYWSYYG